MINSSTVLFSWNAPSAEYYSPMSYLIKYYVELIDSSSLLRVHIMSYTTESTHLLIDSIEPNRQYIVSVAAFTNGRGPFSQTTFATQEGIFCF